MIKEIALCLILVVVIFLGYVSTRESKFRYQRSGMINAPAEKIFPYISDLKMGAQWSPYEKKDPSMKKTITGPGNTVGSSMEFEGNKDTGSGRLEIVGIAPNQRVDIKLTMIKPFHAENLVQYTLTPEAGGTRFSWTMSGDGGFLGKLISVFINCENMVGAEFEKGISNLKALVEKAV